MTAASKIRAARALLDISQADLAKLAALSIPTIKRAESSTGSIAASADAIAAIVIALEKKGVVFIEDGEASAGGGPGVRLRKPGQKV